MLTLPWDNAILPGFFVFEGIDGAGTTTQAQLLTDYLAESRRSTFTFEPSDGPIGTVIRDLLVNAPDTQPRTFSLLYAADRLEHIERQETGIRARLERGENVVCDRYIFSSLAYQGTFDDFETVERLNAAFPLPQHLFFIDTPVEEADRRLSFRAKRDQFEHKTIQESVHSSYRRIVEDFSRTAVCVHYIDGRVSKDRVFDSVRAAIENR